MAPPLDPDHHWGDAASSEGRLRLSHLEVGLPMTRPAAAAAFGDRARHVSEAMAPFVAWLATQDIDKQPDVGTATRPRVSGQITSRSARPGS